MKKTVTLSVACLTALSMSAQLPVSKVAGKKQAYIEEFTGNTCGYCPDGHKRSDDLTSANPGKAFAINVHSGSYATPSSASNSKDFRTVEGNAIHGMAGNSSGGYPKGGVNRRVPTAAGTSPYGSGGWTMNRGYWAPNVAAVLAENTYINVAGQAYVHPTTRAMVVNMEAYYTGAAPSGASMKITVALIQDDIIAYQGGGSSYYPAMVVGSGYRHNHALRKIISAGSTGEAMTGATTAGTTWKKTFNYTVAADIPGGTKTIPLVLDDLEIVAFITDASNGGNVVAVCKVPITQSTSTDIFGLSSPSDLVSFVNVYPNPMANEGAVVFTLAQSSEVSLEVVNALGQIVKSDKLETLDAGEHKYELDATNLTNGIYFVNINVNGNAITKKISILK